MKKLFSFLFLVIFIAGGIFIYPKAKIYIDGLKKTGVNDTIFVYIKTGATLDDVIAKLKDKGIVYNTSEFKAYAESRNLNNRTVRAGKYIISPKDKWKHVVEKLRNGNGEQEVNIMFNHARTLKEIAEKVTANTEVSKEDFYALINNPEVQRSYGFNEHTIRTIFIPNTYRVFWDISAEDLLKRLAEEYKVFWNADRKRKAEEIGLSQSEVSTLASIVYTETPKIEEAPIIAGVYMNRLQKRMPLQADPTLIFAIGDFSIKRVLNVDKEIDSPYNTYKNLGLPPGPIYVSPISYIDAVLNYQKHNYLFFCAKEDFSGYSNFAVTLSQHNENAKRYQNALNNKKTYR